MFRILTFQLGVYVEILRSANGAALRMTPPSVFVLRDSELTSEAVEELPGGGELREAFFFGAEFGGMGKQRASRAACWMLHVKHLVE